MPKVAVFNANKKTTSIKANVAEVMDEFEEYQGAASSGKRTTRQQHSDSDSDDEVIPKALVIECKPTRAQIKSEILEALNSIPKDKRSQQIQSSIDGIKSAFTDEGVSSTWSVPHDFLVTCLQVDKNEDVWDGSKVADSFEANQPVSVECHSFLFVPGKAVIALASCEDQKIEEKGPHITLLQGTSDLRGRAAISNFMVQACTRNGPFTGAYNRSSTAKKANFTAGTVSFRGNPVAAYLLNLTEPMQIAGRTKIYY